MTPWRHPKQSAVSCSMQKWRAQMELPYTKSYNFFMLLENHENEEEERTTLLCANKMRQLCSCVSGAHYSCRKNYPQHWGQLDLEIEHCSFTAFRQFHVTLDERSVYQSQVKNTWPGLHSQYTVLFCRLIAVQQLICRRALYIVISWKQQQALMEGELIDATLQECCITINM